MLVLGIESSCDEMAIAVVKDGTEILSNVIASQSEMHKQFGGVFPEMAARQHVDLLIPTVEKCLEKAGIAPEDLDLIAVAKGPGLIGPLMIGMHAAKSLALAWGLPFIGVNHVEAHLYAAMMSSGVFSFPAIGLVVSGGHTFLTKILDVGLYEIIGTTVDDAVGEAFDKVAALLDLPYPGGPEIEKLARLGDASRYDYRAGRVKERPWDFSFSGLKTNVLYTVKGQNGNRRGETVISDQEKRDVAACFQEVALKDIAERAKLAKEAFGCKAIYVGGGVSQNRRLRGLLSDVDVYFPKGELTVDNGAMIAGLGARLFQGVSDPMSLEPKARLTLMMREGLVF